MNNAVGQVGPLEARADRGSARRQAFLEAARAEFLDRGYEAANVNEVVRRAGGSLATLYAQFGNKEGLFFAVMEDQHNRFIADMMPITADSIALEEGLEAIATQMLRTFLRSEHLAFYRIIVGEGQKFPQLLQRFMGAGADRVRGVVADYMRGRRASDGRVIGDPVAAASFLFEVVRARHHYNALADATYKLSDADVAAHARTAVKMFLNGALAKG